MAKLIQNGHQLGFSSADARLVNYVESDGSKVSVQEKIEEIDENIGTLTSNVAYVNSRLKTLKCVYTASNINSVALTAFGAAQRHVYIVVVVDGGSANASPAGMSILGNVWGNWTMTNIVNSYATLSGTNITTKNSYGANDVRIYEL